MARILFVARRTVPVELFVGVLRRDGFEVRIADEIEPIEQGIKLEKPDLVIFEHKEASDLFWLSPRDVGYGGPLLLLIDTNEPTVLTKELLKPGLCLSQPCLIKDLRSAIAQLLSGTDKGVVEVAAS